MPQYITQLPSVRLSQSSWTFKEKFAIHGQYGKVIVKVTPTSWEIYVADAKIAKQVLDQRTAFHKPNKLLGSKMAAFGPNLATVECEQWQQHRRATGRAFHTKTYQTAWDEAHSRASSLMSEWLCNNAVDHTQADMRALSLDVLFRACFNLEDLRGALGGSNSDILSLREHLDQYIGNPISRKPRALQSMVSGQEVLKEYFERLVTNRKESGNQRDQRDLLSSMMAETRRNGWSESDIPGNLFMFFFAGHETTASVLTYIIHLLAIFPEWQAWASEEVDEVFLVSKNTAAPDFRTFYPYLKRLRAILHETLRLYGPVPTIVRAVNDQDQTLLLADDSVIVPKHTPININCAALHTDPEVWGNDCLEWNPGRWISNASTWASEEECFPQLSGNFFGWGAGPRICPGQRFSQVEVLAIMPSGAYLDDA
ncbi:cytochrome P450 monooxygenase [Penicillium brevicompactum]|uniref:cytochrome P450 monooxygenase n=1 Tax=Penicillium brevicompactum TaxID=5074 RepID=UPI0025404F0B|nr:cytochrome P450 monooxygenase [Penicillium brevicompactum]KAJ5326775.1 cytochrome P450 monooxygenase [Penicillium brevicompactum]